MKAYLYVIGSLILSIAAGVDFSPLRGIEVFGGCLILLAIVSK